MGIQVKISYPLSLQGKGKIEELEKAKPSILLEGGKALQELIADWMRQLQSTRHNRFGAKPSNHFTPNGVLEPRVEKDTVAVPITIPGITRALHDIVISPVEAQSLAIPMHASAYGIQPREYNTDHPKGTKGALFRPKGKDYLAKNENGSLVVMYILRKSVHQPQDETLLPPKDQMAKTAMDAIRNAIGTILSK